MICNKCGKSVGAAHPINTTDRPYVGNSYNLCDACYEKFSIMFRRWLKR